MNQQWSHHQGATPPSDDGFLWIIPEMRRNVSEFQPSEQMTAAQQTQWPIVVVAIVKMDTHCHELR